ncbi:MAG: NUDIX hydrolase [Anaerolineae bacterium]|nr:NUDIX hydrolase [Anaerolineae bacterium]
MPNSNPLTQYLKLMTQQPKQFENPPGVAVIQIISNLDELVSEQERLRLSITAAGKPAAWGDLGVVLDDPYFIILRDLVRFPSGRVGTYSRLINQADLHGGQSVVVLPIMGGKIGLLRQFRHATRRFHLEAPRGYGEPETPASLNAEKEIREEMGGTVVELVDLGTAHNNTGLEATEVQFYLGHVAGCEKPEQDEGIESIEWFNREEFESMIADGSITDGFTLTAYAKAKTMGLL